MRRRIAFSLLFLAACGSGTATTGARPATVPMVGASTGGFNVVNRTDADAVNLAYSADAVWRIMPAVFDSISVPLTTLDHAKKRIGNEGLKIRSRLGKAPLSRYIDCGNTQIGPNADSYDVVLTVVSVVVPDGPTGSKLLTTVEAQSRPITYNQAYSRCTSKSTLETKIAELVVARLTP